jgi:Cytochrome P460
MFIQPNPGHFSDTGRWAPGSKEIHVVYASPGTIAAYRKDGRFPDGSVLVKEVFQAATEEMTTGTVSHAQTLKGWFVMMKDSKDSHPGNKLWGDGWGWSWFDAASPSKTTSTDYKVDCLSCHLPASFRLDLCQRISPTKAIALAVYLNPTSVVLVMSWYWVKCRRDGWTQHVEVS